MKVLPIFSAIALLGVSVAVAQDNPSLKISPEQISPGDSVRFSYQVPDSVEINNVVLRSYAKPSEVEYKTVDFKKNEAGVLEGGFKISDSTSFVILSFSPSKGESAGAYYQVMSSGKPVPYAVGNTALLYTDGMGKYFLGLENDQQKAIDLIEKEIELYPKHAIDFLFARTYALKGLNRLEDARELAEEAKANGIADNDLTEQQWRDLMNAYNNVLEDEEEGETLKELILSRFPTGVVALNQVYDSLRVVETYAARVALRDSILRTFPDEQLNGNRKDWMRMDVVDAAVKEGLIPEAEAMADSISDPIIRASIYNTIAWPLAEKGESLEAAERTSRKSLDLMKEQLSAFEGKEPQGQEVRRKNQLEGNYRMYADTYALIRYHQGNADDALSYQREALNNGLADADGNGRFVTYLYKTGNYEEIPEFSEKAMLEGKSNDSLLHYFEQAYVKLHPNDKDAWKTHFTALQTKALEAGREKLMTEMISQSAPAIDLVNLKGEQVSLAALKGKVVVVDFWATWCGPCKASFPAMQQAVNKYQSDDKVAFLFVNTWERIKDRDDAVKKFISENEYTFNVLMDSEKEGKGKFDVVTAYEVSGIPTKFVIDPDGNIRFKLVGFSGSESEELNKLDMIIDMLKEGENLQASAGNK